MEQMDSFERLVNEFGHLPGVGKKTAQRYAYFLLTMNEADVKDFADAMVTAKEKIHYCKICANFTDKEVCDICARNKKDPIICVVKDPKDVSALEKAREFNGTYHVLHGVINPLEGKGPNDINIRSLLSRVMKKLKKLLLQRTLMLKVRQRRCILQTCLNHLGLKLLVLPKEFLWEVNLNIPMQQL